VIKEMIEKKVVTLEDGLTFATNPHNMLLALKGVSSGDDFNHTGDAPPPAAPRRSRTSSPALDLTR